MTLATVTVTAGVISGQLEAKDVFAAIVSLASFLLFFLWVSGVFNAVADRIRNGKDES